MAVGEQRSTDASLGSSEGLEAVAEVVETGDGLPALARAIGRALEASVAILDRSSSVLAVACASPSDERAVLEAREGVERLDLMVSGTPVGELRLRTRRGAEVAPGLGRALAALTALELERSSQPERASEEAVARFLRDLFQRRVTDRENIVARGKELGTDLGDGAGVLVARAHPLVPTDGDWRARLAATAGRGARRAARGALVGWVDVNDSPELAVLVPGADVELMRRVIAAVAAELAGGLSGFQTAVACSRAVGDPVDLHRAAAEAVLTANVAEARGAATLTFEETGSYRLLLTAISEDPSELHRFFDETVAPLISYDEQYETELVRTLDTFLDEDANVARTAERLFTHRHTIRYRLERVRELTGLDVSSTDGRERLGLGLKAMRVLGMSPPGGPALEAGAEGGRVPRDEKDR
ncbi:MAG TPA: helix-turn-helix domain-containing protein [Thermoleophilaceae bacterium]|nr:helix-turn-helix domain-containing protein [Thermoleophilaceae bacterium]